MRTYKSNRSSSQTAKKESSGKKRTSIWVSAAAVLLVAVAVTLSLTFGLRKSPSNDSVTTVTPPVVEKPTPITFSAPLASCTVKKAAALNKLVYNDTLKQWRTHNGVDFEAASGSDVWVIADGKVDKVENTILEGTVITVSHKDGYVSIYKGLGSSAVQEGDAVSAGAVIGKVGNMMCEQKMGAHLHLEMKKDGKYVVATDYFDVTADK
ncbi:MAG: M23 family metallopeptidase [Clostridiales bacterium]|nr:M23 family metallopeptidase [Clostridiales bacterium]